MGVTVAALVFGPAFMLGPIVLADFILLNVPFGPGPFATAIGALGATAFIGYHMLQNYQWVELDGDVIRGRRFWTRRLVEQRMDAIREVRCLGAAGRSIETLVADRLLGRVRGYEIRFERGPAIGLVRHDMAGVDEFIVALHARLAASRTVEAQHPGPGDCEA